MNTQWCKIAGDFRSHRLQVGLIGLILLLGTAGVVAALNARAILKREIARSYQAARSPDLALWFDRVDAPLLDLVRAQPGVAGVDARRIVGTRIEGPNGTWLPARLLVLRDFSQQHVGFLHQHSGRWPAPDEIGLLIEQSSLPLLPLGVGEPVRVRTPGGGAVAVPVSGILHDPAVAPSTQERIIYAYATPATAARLGQGSELDQVTVLMEDRSSGVVDLGNALREVLVAKGVPPVRVEVLPNNHPHAALMTAMLRVLGVMAAMAFVCSAALAAFSVSLWMKREVRQVGIMKTIGARSHQLAGQYLAPVGLLVAAAVCAGLPAGVLLGRALTRYYETSLNIDVIDWSVPTGLLWGELLGACGIPFLAMTAPIMRAARMTACEAIHDPGITAQTAPHPLTAKLLVMPGDRRLTFALRNTFRRPWRLAITLLALTAGGTLLLTACNLYESLMHVVDLSLAEQGHDIEVTVPRPMPAARLEAIARGLPGVETAEAWRRAGVGLITEADEADGLIEPRHFGLTAYPVDSRLSGLPAKLGRWPAPAETNAIVVTRMVQNQMPGLRVGGELLLKFRERSTKVRVTGVVDEVATPMIYTSFPTYEAVTGLGDGSTDLRIKATQPDAVVPAVDEALSQARIPIGQIQTRADRRGVLDDHFRVVTTVAKMVALAAALVGGICLAAFACLNVLERAREIGVIRALGATPRNVTAIFLAESGAIVLLSLALAAGLSVAATRALNDLTSRELLQVAVPLVVSRTGLALLGGGLAAAMLGVWLPVRHLLLKSVRDALAYE